MSKMALAYNMKKRMKKECHGGDMMAEGGGVMKPERYKTDQGTSAQGHAVRSGNRSMDYSKSPNASSPKIEREMGKESYGRAKEIQGSKPRLADGGDVDNMQDADMIARIMHKRKMYSQGGEVANDDQPMADSMPNDFDDLALRDDLEFHDTGANSGDELGDEQEDHDRKDIVGKIMKSRSKKDRNPRPA